jgi:hypothetical protein
MVKAMSTSEDYRNRAKEARKQANECRNEWERQGLLTIAEQCERLGIQRPHTPFSPSSSPGFPQ